MNELRYFIDRLFGEFGRTVEAVVADGWPEPMVRAGFELHRQTWDVDALEAALRAELAGFGGVAALDGFVEDSSGRRLKLERPKRIAHIWPALPGAGLTPVLFGALLGVPQAIRPSSRGRHFAEHVAAIWPEDAASLDLVTSDDDWRSAEVVVVSGTDQTVAEVRRQAPGARVTGYGHRVSFAVVVDGEGVELAETAASVATDALMWNQAGCFSARGVLFCGSEQRLEAFGEFLGDAIAAEEQRLDAGRLGSAELAARAQARGVAEFTSQIWGDAIGWAQHVDSPFDGGRVATNVVTVHRTNSLAELCEAVSVPRTQLQGVALAAPTAARNDWADALARLGVTRICHPGELQAPPAGWLHDGQPNVLGWLRVVIC